MASLFKSVKSIIVTLAPCLLTYCTNAHKLWNDDDDRAWTCKNYSVLCCKETPNLQFTSEQFTQIVLICLPRNGFLSNQITHIKLNSYDNIFNLLPISMDRSLLVISLKSYKMFITINMKIEKKKANQTKNESVYEICTKISLYWWNGTPWKF
jgi:hypothetical protein